MDPKEQQLEVAFEINKLLNCGLDKETLSICMGILETGVNPEALADVIKQIRKEKQKLLDSESKSATGE
jgi:mitotic-spindle organizing protein 1